MKPFKFRVWSKLENKFDNYFSHISSDGILYNPYDDECESPYNDGYEISYSTGCFDKNMEEIYQYDILVMEESACFDYEKYIIYYDEHNACYMLENIITNQMQCYYYLPHKDNLIIKGNKYKNPELLNKGEI